MAVEGSWCIVFKTQCITETFSSRIKFQNLYIRPMGKPNTLEKSFLFLAFMCLMMSYFFVQDKLSFRIGFYLFTAITLSSAFARHRKLLSTLSKILLSIFILVVCLVIIVIAWFPALKIKNIGDLATYIIMLFAFSFNKSVRKKNPF